MLKFSYEKFIKEMNKNKVDLTLEQIEIIKSWNGKKLHNFSPKSIRRKLFNEKNYILVGEEKIAMSEDYCE